MLCMKNDSWDYLIEYVGHTWCWQQTKSRQNHVNQDWRKQDQWCQCWMSRCWSLPRTKRKTSHRDVCQPWPPPALGRFWDFRPRSVWVKDIGKDVSQTCPWVSIPQCRRKSVIGRESGLRVFKSTSTASDESFRLLGVSIRSIFATGWGSVRRLLIYRNQEDN